MLRDNMQTAADALKEFRQKLWLEKRASPELFAQGNGKKFWELIENCMLLFWKKGEELNAVWMMQNITQVQAERRLVRFVMPSLNEATKCDRKAFCGPNLWTEFGLLCVLFETCVSGSVPVTATGPITKALAELKNIIDM